jgi:hypothetical protein
MLVHSNLLIFSGDIIEMHRVGGEKMFVIPSLSSLSYRGFGDQKNEKSYALKLMKIAPRRLPPEES